MLRQLLAAALIALAFIPAPSFAAHQKPSPPTPLVAQVDTESRVSVPVDGKGTPQC